MNITCVALEEGGLLRPESEPSAVAAWRAGGGPYWIHLTGARPEEVEGWLAGLDLDPELLELLKQAHGETRILALADAVFVGYPMPSDAEGQRTTHFDFLCLDRLLVTMHPELEQSAALGVGPLPRLKLREGSTAGVVCALALVHAARLRRQVVALRGEGDALTDRMDTDPWAVSLGEILALKRRVLTLGGIVDEELAVLEVLKASNLETLPLSRLAGTFQIAIEVTRATDHDIDRLDRRAGDLHRRYESALQERTSRRLGLLTVISAIFRPLTLIAGIYGMNFEGMPELHYRYGYPIALGAMALIAGGLAWYFRARWWGK